MPIKKYTLVLSVAVLVGHLFCNPESARATVESRTSKLQLKYIESIYAKIGAKPLNKASITSLCGFSTSSNVTIQTDNGDLCSDLLIAVFSMQVCAKADPRFKLTACHLLAKRVAGSSDPAKLEAL